MPNEEEIIEIMRKARANEPEKFDDYMEFYKKNHAQFYEKKLLPVFEAQLRKPKVVEKKQPINPVEALSEELPPLGSANVGEELSSETKPLTKTTTEPSIPATSEAIQRKKNPLKTILILLGSVIGMGVIGGVVYFLFLAP